MKQLRNILLYIALSACSIVALPADARPHGGIPNGSVPATCPQGTSYTNSRGDHDGCLNAPVGVADNVTLFQHTNFFTSYATQSGQTYDGRPPWNVSGVDYPAGIPTAKKATFKDPAVDTLPTGCTYQATGSQTGTPLVNCQNAVSPDFENFDWSGTYVGAAHGCVVLATGLGTGTFTMKYNYFGPTSQCNGAANYGHQVAIYNLSSYACDYEYNTFNGVNAQLTGVNSALSVFSPCPGGTTALYNAAVNTPSRFIQGNAQGSQFIEFNYIENYTFDEANQGHSEMLSNTAGVSTGQGGTMAQNYYFYNTILQGSVLNQGDITTTIWLSNGNSGSDVTYTDAEVLNNTTVVNQGQGGGMNQSSLAAINVTQTATQIRDNYSDNTGTDYYAIMGGATCTAPIAWSGNYLLTGVLGGTVSKAAGLFDGGGNTGC